MKNDHESDAIWLMAFDHWLAGLFFAIVVSIFVIAGAQLPLVGSLFRSIEAAGVDAAMRARNDLFPRQKLGKGAEDYASGFVFIDLNTKSCMEAEHDNWCETLSPASPLAATRVAIAALQGHPRMIILDVRLWDLGRNQHSPSAAFKDLVSALKKNPETKVLAVAPFRPGEVPDSGTIVETLIPAELAGGQVKFAPAYAWNADSVIRRYPKMIAVNGARVATLPYLAAAFAEAGSQKAGLDHADCMAWPSSSRVAKDCDRPNAQTEEQTPLEQPLQIFSFQSIAEDAGGHRSKTAAALRGLYDWYPSSDIAPDLDRLAVNPVLLDSKIVVIGTSARQAMDWHMTPIGEMAGAEVLINVVRAFASGAELREPDVLGKILREAGFGAVGSLPFFGFWFLFFWIKRSRFAHRYGSLVAPVTACVTFPLTIAISFTLMILSSYWPAGRAFLGGYTWDLFTPLAALSLECFCDAGSKVSGIFEHGVRRLRIDLVAFVVARRRRKTRPKKAIPEQEIA